MHKTFNVFGLAVELSFSWDRYSPWEFHLLATEFASNYLFYIRYDRNLFLDLVSYFCGGIPTYNGYVFQRKKAYQHFQFLLGIRDPNINKRESWSDCLEEGRYIEDPLDFIPF
jgi:hypothetical protein